MTQINIQVKKQDQNYKQPGAGAIIGGVVVGATVKKIVSTPRQILSPMIFNKMLNISKNLTDAEVDTIEKAAQETIQSPKFVQKGIGVIKATSQNADEISNIMAKEMDNIVILKY